MQKVLTRHFGTRYANPEVGPRPWSGRAPLSRKQLGKQLRHKYHGYLGRGIALKKPFRRWRGGRYNYFAWDTLVTCIEFCPSVVERDRMPSPLELNYFYRGASIGIIYTFYMYTK